MTKPIPTTARCAPPHHQAGRSFWLRLIDSRFGRPIWHLYRRRPDGALLYYTFTPPIDLVLGDGRRDIIARELRRGRRLLMKAASRG